MMMKYVALTGLSRVLLAVSAAWSIASLTSSPAAAQTSPPCLSWNGLRFMTIPEGSFRMGANDVSESVSGFVRESTQLKRGNKGFKDEYPPHTVSIKRFCIMHDSLSRAQAIKLLGILNVPKSYLFDPDEDTSAVGPIAIKWDQAVAFSKALTKHLGRVIRLPTEAEWEYAARGGFEDKQFPWGNVSELYKDISVRDIVLSARQHCKADAVLAMAKGSIVEKCVAAAKAQSDFVELSEVACYSKLLSQRVSISPENGYGLINLINNQWEWTSSRYMPYPYNPNDGREAPPALKKEARAIRGGNNDIESCLGYTALRGYGRAGTAPREKSTYAVRFVLEN
jgi:formylglycine-generating enzyme required for sulfatase activity